jgi:hypothetical protein
MECIPCNSAPAVHWNLLPVTRLASRKILVEQNIKKRTGPALCVLRSHYPPAPPTREMQLLQEEPVPIMEIAATGEAEQ